jgi:hypothetical protein
LFGRKARKGWEGPFIIKKVRQNKEIVIWDEVMWYAYVESSEIKMEEYHVREGDSDEDKPTPKRHKSSA